MQHHLETILNGLVLIYYLITSIFAAAYQPKHQSKLGNNSQRLFILTTCGVLAASLSLCFLDVVLIRTRDDFFRVTTIDDSLFADLLQSLQWLVLLLAHIDDPGVVRYPHCGVWILSTLTRLLATGRYLPPNLPKGTATITILLLVTNSILSSLLFAATVILQYLARRIITTSNDGETQPLLEHNNPDDVTTTGEQEEEEEDDDERKESAEQKQARKELHDRPFWEYLSSFSVYLALLLPADLRQKLYLSGMCFCMLLLRVVAALMPLALGSIIDALSEAKAPWLPIATYFTLYFLQSNTGISLIEEYLHLLTSNHQKLSVARAAYNHVMDLSADFQDSATKSDVWEAMQQAQSVITLFHTASFEVLPMIIDLCTGLVIVWTIFGAYMGILIATLVVLMVWTCVHSVASRVSLNRKWVKQYYESYHQMVDSTENWYTAAQFGRIPAEKEVFLSKQTLTLEGRNKLVYWYYKANVQRFSILTGAYLFAASLAAKAIINGELTVGAFATLTGYWSIIAQPIMYLVHDIIDSTDKLVDAEKLLILFEKKPTIVDSPDAKPFVYMGGAVEFENVSFSYNGDKTAAKGVTFRSKPGQIIAFVGETGGGKSTILKLLMRFYDPEQGRILIDGQDIRNLQLDSFRNYMAVVPQEPSMFHTTILENVRYADPSISEEEVQAACKTVALHNKITTFKRGYLTKVGERGCKLSGGEKQRLAIARAILKKPKILLLDEATSSVDSVTEEQIQSSLDKACKDRSTFVIAHRLSTIIRADQILVIEGGKLVETGTHCDLIRKHGGAYHKLWKSQLKLQGERSRSRSKSESRAREQPLTLIDDIGDAAEVASLVNEDTTPPEDFNIQTPEDGDSAERGRAVVSGFSVFGVGGIFSRFASSSPGPKEVENRVGACGTGVAASERRAGESEGVTLDHQNREQQIDGSVGLEAGLQAPRRRTTKSENDAVDEPDVE